MFSNIKLFIPMEENKRGEGRKMNPQAYHHIVEIFQFDKRKLVFHNMVITYLLLNEL